MRRKSYIFYLLANKFSIYFIPKTTIIKNKIMSDTTNTTCNISMDAHIMFNGNMFINPNKTSDMGLFLTFISSPNLLQNIRKAHSRAIRALVKMHSYITEPLDEG